MACEGGGSGAGTAVGLADPPAALGLVGTPAHQHRHVRVVHDEVTDAAHEGTAQCALAPPPHHNELRLLFLLHPHQGVAHVLGGHSTHLAVSLHTAHRSRQ